MMMRRIQKQQMPPDQRKADEGPRRHRGPGPCRGARWSMAYFNTQGGRQDEKHGAEGEPVPIAGDVGNQRGRCRRHRPSRIAGGTLATCGGIVLTVLATLAGEWNPATNIATPAGWILVYVEDFSTPLNDAVTPWLSDSHYEPFDTIMDDGGLWYRNDYGPDWETAYNSFTTYRKEFPVGQDGWLTASLSARDWDKDGLIETPPSIRTELQGDKYVAVLDVPDHTGGAIFRPTEALPPRYRIEYKLTTLDFGGRRHGALEYEGRINGYDAEGCKTQHPWGGGSNSRGWSGDASAPYCEWQDVRAGPYGYNGFHFLAIVDFADPAPRNNHFWHYRRKVLMDAFSQHPDRVGSGTVVDEAPIWHYNVADDEYDGRFNGDLVQNDAYGSMTWPDQWPAGSAYPDYFVIGDLYTNVYEGSASLTDIRLYVPATDATGGGASHPRRPEHRLPAAAYDR